MTTQKTVKTTATKAAKAPALEGIADAMKQLEALKQQLSTASEAL